jgi:hypothetical protein
VTFEPDESLCVVGRPLFRVVGDEVFILMPNSLVHWLKNPTARTVWERLHESGEAGVTPRDLAVALTREFAVSEERALVDVLAFVGQLAARQLVTRATSRNAPD